MTTNRYTGTSNTSQPWLPGTQTRAPMTQDYATFDQYMKAMQDWQKQMRNAVNSPDWWAGALQKPWAQAALNRGVRQEAPAEAGSGLRPGLFPRGGSTNSSAGGSGGSAGGSGSTVNLPANNTYATTPAPLSADELADIDGRRIALDSLLSEAEAAYASGSDAANAQAVANARGLNRSAMAARQQQIGELSARGLGLSPSASGRLINMINEGRAAGLANIEGQRAGNILQLGQRRDDAARKRNEGYAALNRLIASRGGDVAALLPGVRF